MDEFAMGSSNETSFYGPVKNPWDPRTGARRLVGRLGRGGRCAHRARRHRHRHRRLDPPAGRALRTSPGFKPTYGRVSRYGMIAFASSLDQAGVLDAVRRGRRAAARRDGGLRPARLDERRRAGARTTSASSNEPLKGLQHRPAAASSSTRGSTRAVGKLRARGARHAARAARRQAARGEPAEPAAVGADVLRRRAGGVLVEPVALRRRALRPSLREPAAT